MRSAAAFQLVIVPSRFLLRIASNEDSTSAASQACLGSAASGSGTTPAPDRDPEALAVRCATV
jgi:hypothetical protein